MPENGGSSPAVQPAHPQNACLLRAALRGEISLGDDDLLVILSQEDGASRAKQLCLGLKTAGLITADQAALAFYAFLMKEA